MVRGRATQDGASRPVRMVPATGRDDAWCVAGRPGLVHRDRSGWCPRPVVMMHGACRATQDGASRPVRMVPATGRDGAWCVAGRPRMVHRDRSGWCTVLGQVKMVIPSTKAKHHAPSTMNQAPCTKHHAPSQAPRPSTMHQAPCTKPSTMHQAPCTMHQHVWRWGYRL